MIKKNLIMMSLCLLVFLMLSGCIHSSETNEKNLESNQIFQDFLYDRIIETYRKITQSGNIQENIELNIKGTTKTTIFGLTISASISKNLLSGAQNGTYKFMFINENKTFLEKTTISGDINIVSIDGRYFIKPENVQFQGPKGKQSNNEIERKISEINNKWIKIDKEIPLTSFLETILNVQGLSYELLKSEEKQLFLETKTHKNGSMLISNTSTNYENLYSTGLVYSNSGNIYLSGIEKLTRQKNGNKFKVTNFLKKGSLISDVKIRRGQKKIKIYFDSSLIYNNLPKSTQEVKLDIKGKYIITSNGNAEINVPEDYINFTETSISKK